MVSRIATVRAADLMRSAVLVSDFNDINSHQLFSDPLGYHAGGGTICSVGFPALMTAITASSTSDCCSPTRSRNLQPLSCAAMAGADRHLHTRPCRVGSLPPARNKSCPSRAAKVSMPGVLIFLTWVARPTFALFLTSNIVLCFSGMHLRSQDTHSLVHPAHCAACRDVWLMKACETTA